MSILDSEGEILQPPMFRQESSSTELKPKRPYTETWVLAIDKPGQYQIEALARYTFAEENESLNGGLLHVHNLKSEPAAIEVRYWSAFYAPPICET
ncbi:hypothetical protein [Paenibacillus contaminans]|uniref:Uncharacterized protein n=1 Tax=Paenibacillus contaminans TaxID=450362 RepID=A0A329M423_9BACL|nr:hypothetical protein [Paenibacillus contaminans]RAV11727.1 hypothetical protein DQG23_35780 [Paenibacillus contaminans]